MTYALSCRNVLDSVIDMEQPRIFDNITNKVIDDLRVRLLQGSRLSIAAASFSIYAYEALKAELESMTLL